MRLPIIAANWKMNLLLNDARNWVKDFKHSLPELSSCGVVVAPPFTSLSTVKNELAGTEIQLAGQDIGLALEGAHTGDISAKMLKDVGCDYVILGHSERRRDHHESDSMVNEKIKIALSQGLKIIFCLGENEKQRQDGETQEIVKEQLLSGLSGISSEEINHIVIAYEPVWAIGTGNNATPEQAQEVHAFIRTLVAQEYGDAVASHIRILYGGSVKSKNSKDLLGQPDIDGALVGGASLVAHEFCAIINTLI